MLIFYIVEQVTFSVNEADSIDRHYRKQVFWKSLRNNRLDNENKQ